MSLQYSSTSARRLLTCHLDLQFVFREALAMGILDITILEGHRSKEKQDRYYVEGKSKIKYPKGKHNKKPSDAIDAAPWIKDHVSFNKAHCCVLAGIVLTCAKKLGINIRWGGNWDMDLEPITDQDFQDLVHYERIGGDA